MNFICGGSLGRVQPARGKRHGPRGYYRGGRDAGSEEHDHPHRLAEIRHGVPRRGPRPPGRGRGR